MIFFFNESLLNTHNMVTILESLHMSSHLILTCIKVEIMFCCKTENQWTSLVFKPCFEKTGSERLCSTAGKMEIKRVPTRVFVRIKRDSPYKSKTGTLEPFSLGKPHAFITVLAHSKHSLNAGYLYIF